MGCDDVLESGAQPDSCGVCNGDDSGATFITDTLTGSGGFGYHTAGVIPAGARNVRIAEATATSSVYLGKILSSYIYIHTAISTHICVLVNTWPIISNVFTFYIALQSQGQPILNNGFRVRETSSFSAIGSTFQYVRSSTEESVFTTGPLQQQLTIQV